MTKKTTKGKTSRKPAAKKRTTRKRSNKKSAAKKRSTKKPPAKKARKGKGGLTVGQSKTTNPKSADALVKDVVAKVAGDIKKAGLIQKGK